MAKRYSYTIPEGMISQIEFFPGPRKYATPFCLIAPGDKTDLNDLEETLRTIELEFQKLPAKNAFFPGSEIIKRGGVLLIKGDPDMFEVTRKLCGHNLITEELFPEIQNDQVKVQKMGPYDMVR